MRPVFDATDGVDGRVSIEVSPGFAHDTEETVKEAAELWEIVGEPNLLIKIPGTKEGWPAITETIARRHLGQRHADLRPRAVPQRHGGLRLRARAGRRPTATTLADIHSVASFFVSRVDTEIDKRLDATTEGPGTDPDLKGKAGVANARLAFQMFEEFFTGDALGGARGRGRAQAAAAVGLDRREEPRLRRHDVRRRPGRRGHRQHHAGEDPRRRRRPRRGAGRPGPAVLRRRRTPTCTRWPRRASTTTT